jgi:hypothetical protein
MRHYGIYRGKPHTTHASEDRLADGDTDGATERAQEAKGSRGRGHVAERHRRLDGEERCLEQEADTKCRDQQVEYLLDTSKSKLCQRHRENARQCTYTEEFSSSIVSRP